MQKEENKTKNNLRNSQKKQLKNSMELNIVSLKSLITLKNLKKQRGKTQITISRIKEGIFLQTH